MQGLVMSALFDSFCWDSPWPTEQFSYVEILSNGWSILVFVFAGSVAVAYFANTWRKQQELKLDEVRSRIATDLHDDIGSSLSQVAIMCEVLSRQSADERETLQEIAGVSRNVLASMSEIVWAVDPSHDHLRDLTQRMRWFAGETLAGRGVNLDFSASEPCSDVRLGADIRRQIFLIFKECINNIARHSGATQSRVLLHIANNQLALLVTDNGKGFDLKQMADGHGLRNINHRARLLRASLETQSIVGRGTMVELRVPIVQTRARWHLPAKARKRSIGQ